jgi:hypothetical protein
LKVPRSPDASRCDNRRMLPFLLAGLFFALHAVQAPDGVTGEWAASVTAPRGVLEYTMYLKQEGPRVSGYFQSEFGEMPLRGTIKDTAITLSWTMPDAKEPIEVTMTGTVKGDAIEGDATLGKVGKGSFHAERTGS